MRGIEELAPDDSQSVIVDFHAHPSSAELLAHENPCRRERGGGPLKPEKNLLKSNTDDGGCVPAIRAETIEDRTAVPCADTVDDYPDGGWGWLCVLGSFIATFILGGVEKSFGLIFGDIEDKFHASALATSWVGSLSTTCRLTLGFLGGILSAKYSCRAVSIAGGLMYALGVGLSAYPLSLGYLYVFYGLLPGLGGSMIYVSSTLIVNEYFNKRRGIANGIASAGSGMGSLCMPLFIQWLLENYGYFGEMLIVGATVLHICVSGALYRPRTRPKCSKAGAGSSHASSSPRLSAEATAPLLSWSSLNRRLSRGWKELQRHVNVLRNARFSLFCSSIFLLYMSYLPSVYFLPALAESASMPKSSAAFLLSIIGASDMCGRILSGFLFDVKKVKPYRAYIYNTAYLWLALAGISQTLSSQYYQFCICSAVHGFFHGICVAQRSVIVTDVVGDQAVNHAVGLLITCQGLGVATGPSVAGLLVDLQGGYKAPFYFCAATQMIAGVLFAANLFVHRIQLKKMPLRDDASVKPAGTGIADGQHDLERRPRSSSKLSGRLLHFLSAPGTTKNDLFSSFNFEDDLYACYLSHQSLAADAVPDSESDERGSLSSLDR